EAPDSGQVRFRGQDCARTDATALRARHIGFVFQACHLIPTLTALQNVELPMLETAWSTARRRERARELLDAVGLADRGTHRPAQLSGGQRQRVAIARALANEPELLIADEPTGNLDSASAARCLELLAGLRRARGLTLVMATHDAGVAAGADRIVSMRDGRIESDR
ncbi:MAG: ATP-binding cassette domain-containing protein, partial [Bryobacterales bacterium]|nr:ATP-binding cassette domain-containing protein [Bryobacterales bacterium]